MKKLIEKQIEVDNTFICFSITFLILIRVFISLSEGYLLSYLQNFPARSMARLTFIFLQFLRIECPQTVRHYKTCITISHTPAS